MNLTTEGTEDTEEKSAGVRKFVKKRSKAKWFANPLAAWLIAFFAPVAFPLIATLLSPIWNQHPQPEFPQYPQGITEYRSMTPQQKEMHSAKVRQWQHEMDSPYASFYLAWIGVTILSLLGFVRACVVSLKSSKQELAIGLTLLTPYYILLAGFMFIGWSFRHG